MNDCIRDAFIEAAIFAGNERGLAQAIEAEFRLLRRATGNKDGKIHAGLVPFVLCRLMQIASIRWGMWHSPLINESTMLQAASCEERPLMHYGLWWRMADSWLNIPGFVVLPMFSRHAYFSEALPDEKFLFLYKILT